MISGGVRNPAYECRGARYRDAGNGYVDNDIVGPCRRLIDVAQLDNVGAVKNKRSHRHSALSAGSPV